MPQFCICCGQRSEYSIQLAVGTQANRLLAMPRDSLRATILYLQAGNEQISVKPV